MIDTANKKLAVMEMGDYWEPGLPLLPGTLEAVDQIQLLWGYPALLGLEPAGSPLHNVFEQWQVLWSIPFTGTPGSVITGSPVDKYIVDFDGDMFQLTMTDSGELEFSDDFEVHTSPSDVASPVYTEE